MREPGTVHFVKQIVASYGYTDPDVLALRSQRDHNGTQYLQYDYGLVSYMDTMSFLEQGVGNGGTRSCCRPAGYRVQGRVRPMWRNWPRAWKSDAPVSMPQSVARYQTRPMLLTSQH